MRIIFAGTPDAALPTLQRLVDSSHEIVAVITRPPARAGRGRTPVSSPVARYAAPQGLNLIEVSNLRGETIAQELADLDADLGVVVAFGALVPAHILSIPRHGWINLHFSDLPRWRGAAPVQWAIRSGDERTASCVFLLEEGLDTGPIFARLETPIGENEDAGALLERLSTVGADQVLDVVDAINAGTATAHAQDESQGITRARMLTHEDGFVTFCATAQETSQLIRSVSPNPGAWTLLPDGRRMKIRSATVVDTPSPGLGRLCVSKKQVLVGCTDMCICLGKVAPAGKQWMEAPAWARGARLDEDARLGQTHTREGQN